jgi:hypothetical protein
MQCKNSLEKISLSIMFIFHTKINTGNLEVMGYDENTCLIYYCNYYLEYFKIKVIGNTQNAIYVFSIISIEVKLFRLP